MKINKRISILFVIVLILSLISSTVLAASGEYDIYQIQNTTNIDLGNLPQTSPDKANVNVQYKYEGQTIKQFYYNLDPTGTYSISYNDNVLGNDYIFKNAVITYNFSDGTSTSLLMANNII